MQKSSGSFKNIIYKMCLQIYIYIYVYIYIYIYVCVCVCVCVRVYGVNEVWLLLFHWLVSG